MKVAAIDIGANSILGLIADVFPPHQIFPLFEQTFTTRLGEFSIGNELTPAAIEQSMRALRELMQRISAAEVRQIVIVATSVLREARNREILTARVKTEFGLPVEILSADAEAEFSFLGALSNKPDLAGRTLVFDIGGGSTELVLGIQKEVRISTSLPVGALKLTRQFFRTDPPNATELSQLKQFLQATIRTLPAQLKSFGQIVGVGGTVTALAAMHLAAEKYIPEKIDGLHLEISELEQLLNKLIGVPMEKRKKIVGLEPERADIIIGGAVLLVELLKWFGANQIIVSDRCLRYGAILKLILHV